MSKEKKESMTVKLDDSTLTIVIPILKPLMDSKSGKSLTVATTHGNVPTEVTLQGKPVIIGINAYIKKS